VANGKILQRTQFKKLFIQPAAGDAGSAMGAALYAHYFILGHPRTYVMEHAYLGPEFSDTAIEQFLKEHGITYTRFSSPRELLTTTARLFHQNQVIGWFQGRMEWGPRALGARSILANPCNSKMKDILNLKVKHREHFRPFAPVVCIEDAQTYFLCDTPVPKPTDFMLMVYPVKPDKRKLLPAITHVDGSGRLQTIRKQDHPLYWSVIQAFGKLSGVPVLVNTSFNIRGEPIVCTPSDAYKCMMGTGIDCLVIGNFLIKRADNLRDAWNSESIATD
jgi:carbamoyltransferase